MKDKIAKWLDEKNVTYSMRSRDIDLINDCLQDIDGWVSVEDRLPEEFEGNKVLGTEGYYVFECEYEDGIWCNFQGEEMTHWKPLPEPPK